MQREELKISEQLREVLETFSEEWEIWQEENYVFLKYEDAYEIVDVSLEINEYGNVINATYEYATVDEEIITPESCHNCSEYCDYYDRKRDMCKITDKMIEKEINQWVNVSPLITSSLEIRRIIKEECCYLDIPHNHVYKGYQVEYKRANNIDFKTVLDIIDILIEIYEKYLEKIKRK